MSINYTNGFEADFSREGFPSQQEQERILYIARPHWSMFLIGATKVIFLTSCACLLWWSRRHQIELLGESIQEYGYYALGGIGTIMLLWKWKYFKTLRSYITERRIVRFEAVFPVTEKRRALFWREVTKTRGIAPNVIWRAINIGTVEVSPLVTEHGGGLYLPYTYYFEDLAGYLDKIIHITKQHPDKIPELRPFILKPKGHRWPQESPQQSSAKIP